MAMFNTSRVLTYISTFVIFRRNDGWFRSSAGRRSRRTGDPELQQPALQHRLLGGRGARASQVQSGEHRRALRNWRNSSTQILPQHYLNLIRTLFYLPTNLKNWDPVPKRFFFFFFKSSISMIIR